MTNYSYESILNAITSGVPADEIANGFADMLNKVIEETSVEAKREKQKKQDMECIREAIFNYLEDYYPQFFEKHEDAIVDIFDSDITEWIGAVDETIEMVLSPEWKSMIDTIKYIKDFAK